MNTLELQELFEYLFYEYFRTLLTYKIITFSLKLIIIGFCIHISTSFKFHLFFFLFNWNKKIIIIIFINRKFSLRNFWNNVFTNRFVYKKEHFITLKIKLLLILFEFRLIIKPHLNVVENVKQMNKVCFHLKIYPKWII